jgi:hypothetical protein
VQPSKISHDEAFAPLLLQQPWHRVLPMSLHAAVDSGSFFPQPASRAEDATRISNTGSAGIEERFFT